MKLGRCFLVTLNESPYWGFFEAYTPQGLAECLERLSNNTHADTNWRHVKIEIASLKNEIRPPICIFTIPEAMVLHDGLRLSEQYHLPTVDELWSNYKGTNASP